MKRKIGIYVLFLLMIFVSTSIHSSAASITVVSPNGGETLVAGFTHKILWGSSFLGAGNVKIEYSINNGSNWTTIVSETSNDGSYDWIVPLNPSAACKIKLTSKYIFSTYTDASNAVFSIVLPQITLTSPNGSEIWSVNSSKKITWTSIGVEGDVKIEYSTNGGSSWANVVSSTENDGEYSWTIPCTPSANCKVRISEASDGDPADMSDSIFTIKATTPSLTTNVITSITPSSAVCGGNITSDGGASVTSRGVCWSTSANPTTADSKTQDGNGIGSFTSTITGLSYNTTYYVRAYATNSMGTSYGNNRNFTTTITLDIESAPEKAVAITVSPNDNSGNGNGNTNFKRTYNPGVEVTLTAPASYNDKNFIKWVVDSSNRSGRTIKVKMDSAHTAQAVYRSSTYTLTVQSSPASGIPIVVKPTDKNNNGVGNTAFIRTYDYGTIVTLTAPSKYNGKNFVRWLIDGTANNERTISVTMDSNHTVQAVYEADTYPLIVQSTPYTGIGITVNPVDKDGNGNGNTNFTRTYETDKTVTLTAPSVFNGSKFIKWSIDGKEYTNRTVQVKIDADHNAVAYYESTNPPEISVSRRRLNFGYIQGSKIMPVETFTVYNSGGGTLNWTASTEIKGVDINPPSGSNYGVVEVTVNPVGLLPAIFKGVIYVTDPLVSNSPIEVEINLCVKKEGTPPFGDFSTPMDGSTVYNSVPVTGWVLGDTGIESVKIYREDGAKLVYIGDALFVEGARPDIEIAYPDFPMNYKAGWGYMMLTNFLPNGGNGVYKIHAIAKDKEGRTADLGTKTITVYNASVLKPFGAIDIPAPGGTTSGNNYRNQGWALAPLPNKIPINGSTINVYIDGIYVGHPVYNIYRPDIAALFPGYANVNGAGGYIDIDTTIYEDGIHTMHWTAADNAGNIDGIGSRFFIIQNTSGCMTQISRSSAAPDNIDISRIPMEFSEPVTIIKSYAENQDIQETYPDDQGNIDIEILELERVEIHWQENQESPESKLNEPVRGNSNWMGFHVIGDQLRPLPVGSFMDRERGIFYWQPGVGFYGDYELAFINQHNADRKVFRIRIRILPKY